MKLFLGILFAYLLGSIPFGLLITRWVMKIDIREHGSRNIGATNVFRVAGKKWGILVFILDALKGYLGVKVPIILGCSFEAPFNIFYAMTAIVGHSFPVWLRFKGGKGVATSFGAFLAVSFLPCILAFGFFCVVLILGKILSLASLSAAVAFPVLIFFLYSSRPGHSWYLGISLLLCVFIFFTHHQNVRRLLKGEEKRIF